MKKIKAVRIENKRRERHLNTYKKRRLSPSSFILEQVKILKKIHILSIGKISILVK